MDSVTMIIVNLSTNILRNKNQVIERALHALDGMCINLKTGEVKKEMDA